MKGWVTINTDAGFYHIERIGSYAYWIKGDDIFLKGSGVFKEPCKGPHDAETKAIINALSVLMRTGRTDFVKIVFNRDNINASNVGKNEAARTLQRMLNDFRKACGYNGKKFFEFRHVKAHTHTDTAKHWVNDWLDKKCKEELRNFKIKQKNA